MIYAGIIVFDHERRRWRCIGVVAQDPSGEVLIRVEQNDRLVQATPLLHSMEEYFNREFQEGEVRFYRRTPDEMSSHVEVLKTTDPEFLQKYDAELAGEGKHIRLWNIRESQNSGSLDDVIGDLLTQVRRECAQISA